MTDIRDIAVVAALIALSLLGIFAALAIAVGGYYSLRLVRAARRLHDRRAAPALDRLVVLQGELNERRIWEASGLAGAALDGLRLLRRRRRKKRRRFGFLRR